MGDPSYVDNHDVTVNDLEGLKQYYKDIDDGIDKYHKLKQIYKNAVTIHKRKEFGDVLLDFDGLSNLKIITYWYPEFVSFLRDIAIFIEGNVELSFSDGESFAKIVFQDEECIIEIGEIEWEKYSPKDLRKDIVDMPGKLKKRLCAMKI